MNQHVTVSSDPLNWRWYVVRTKPAAEYAAEVEMRRVGISVYMPQFRREYRHHRSKAWITRQFPLFNGYLFIRADDLKWGALASCKGLERDAILCSASGNRMEIKGSVIERIRENEECGAFDETRQNGSRLQIGQRVKIAEGPFTGIEGPLSHVKCQKNVRLLINIFNREVEATIPIAKIGKKD